MSIPTAESSVAGAKSTAAALRGVLPTAIGLAAQAVAIFVIAYFLLGGRSRDLHTPLRFGNDSAAYLMQSKVTLEEGWWWSNPRAAAPSTLNNLLWPSHTNVDQVLIKVVGLATREMGLTINVTWLLMLALAGVSATYCMRILGVGRLSSAVMGSLFALCPFAIYRNLEHFTMTTYLVPFSATLAVLVAARGATAVGRLERWSLYAGCVLTGFNYAYNALFGTVFLVVGVVTAIVSGMRLRDAMPGVLGIGAIVLATGISVLPSYRAYAVEGRPVTLPQKLPAEAEVYGLKIRHLLTPLWGQTFAPLAAWNKRDGWARFPLETENTAARLGIVAALGLMGSLGCVLASVRLGHSALGRTALAAGQMSVAGILFATIGGFGVLFNMFVAADVRGQNRISVFLAFFALFVVALGCDWVMRRSRVAAGVLLATVLMVGLWDQSLPFAGLNAEAAATRDEYRRLESLVREMEADLPQGSRVLELPLRVYFNEPNRVRQVVHDHFKPYLVSGHLRWSYPALSNEQVRWQRSVMRVSEQDLPAVMAREGFAALWVDKFAYEDSAASLLAKLETVAGARLRWVTERYAVVDIQAAQAAPGQVLPTVSGELRPVTTALAPCPVAPIASIDYVGGAPGPFDTPVPWPANRELKIRGWFIPGDRGGVAAGVDAALDGTYVHVYDGFPRPDVAAAYGAPQFENSGFVTVVPGALLTPGAHVLSFRVASVSGECVGTPPDITLAVR